MSRPHPRASKMAATQAADVDRSRQFQLETLQPRILLSVAVSREAELDSVGDLPVVDFEFAVGEPAPVGSEFETALAEESAIDGPNTKFSLNPDAEGDEVASDEMFTTELLIDDSGEAVPDGIMYTMRGDAEPVDLPVENSDWIFYSMGAPEAGETPVDVDGETEVTPDCEFTLEAGAEEAENLEDPIFFQVTDDLTGTEGEVPADGIFYMRAPEEGETFEDLAAVQTVSLLEAAPEAAPAPVTTEVEASSDNEVAAPPTAGAVEGAAVNPLLSKSEELLGTSGSVLS